MFNYHYNCETITISDIITDYNIHNYNKTKKFNRFSLLLSVSGQMAFSVIPLGFFFCQWPEINDHRDKTCLSCNYINCILLY